MKNGLKNIFHRFIFSDKIPLEGKLINTIFLSGIIFASAGVITRIFMGASIFLLLVVLAIVISIACLMYICNHFNLYTLCAGITIVLVCDILLPAAYFTLGGVASSASGYFILSVVIIVLLSKGKSGIIFLGIHITIILLCYYISYLYPNLVIRLADLLIYENPLAYWDHIQSIFIIGGCIGLIIKIQNKIYLMERGRAEDSHRQVLLRDNLLHLVNNAAVILLASGEDQFEESLIKSMEDMACCVDVDRICIWKFRGPGELPRYLKMYEWLRSGDPRRKNKNVGTLPEYFEGIAHWEYAFSQGRPFNGPVKSLSAEERNLLPNSSVLSVLAIPVSLQDEFWGFVSFGDYREERHFSVQEEGILQSAGLLIATAVARNEMTENLIQAREEALISTRAKSQFLARISHEIRTPLNAIIGLSEVELGKSTGLYTESMNNLENIYNSGTTLLNIINDILDVSKIESGKMELVPVEYALANMINDAVSLNVVRVGSKPIVFELRLDETIPSRLFGDELRVRQILNNLLSNAIKYTREGRVILDIGFRREEDRIELICAVRDTGIGIRQEDMEKLFAEYNQIDTESNRTIEGTGLGLSITKNLLEMMSGSISVESEYGRGSAFTVRIPQGIVNDEPLGGETAASLKNFRFKQQNRERIKNMVRKPMPYARVLVVDDVVTNLAVAKGIMAPYGMIVDGVTSGKMAVEFLRKENVRYDAVFMDHMMPGMDGIEAVRIIRNEIGTDYARNVPIIALTANALVGNEQMFLDNGFQGFLPKPINIQTLDSILNQWVRDPARETSLEDAVVPPPPSPELEMDDSLWELKLAGINVEAALDRMNGIRESYLEILRAFVRHTPAQLNKLPLNTAETLGEYAITVHGLKGANYGIGADEAGHGAAALEALAKAGQFEAILEGTPPFIKTMEKLIAAIEAVTGSLRSGPEEGPKPRRDEPEAALLADLLEACKRYDMETMERLLSVLEGYAYLSGGDLIAELREDLDNLEYDTLRKRLENLMS
ncbi:MAG: response regulator [Spirochaetales bacterium]|jgi:signal transduction histidine kinase/CheY-like chemotaxis protein/HPt (histidine-containing phosphotransfer) domain-containing protein|nr:response regulator [Spirochaetales bacterium]